MSIPLNTNLTMLTSGPLADISLIKGGHMFVDTVANLTDGTIPAARRTAGMKVTVITPLSDYQLGSDMTTWTAATGVSAGSVTNSLLANVATGTFKGRSTAGTGSPEDLTAAQATAMLNAFSGGVKGLVPASDGVDANSKFLRKDGTFATPGISGLSGSSDIQLDLTDTLTDRAGILSFSTAITDEKHSWMMMGVGLKYTQDGVIADESATAGNEFFGYGWGLERGFIDAVGNYQHEFYTTTAGSERTISGGTRPQWNGVVSSIVANASGCIVTTSTVHPLRVGLRIDFPTLNTPSGVAANTFYWVAEVLGADPDQSTSFRIATTKAFGDAGNTTGTTAWTSGTGTVRMGGHGNFNVGGNTPAVFNIVSTDYGVLGNDQSYPVVWSHGTTVGAATVYFTATGNGGIGNIGLWTGGVGFTNGSNLIGKVAIDGGADGFACLTQLKRWGFGDFDNVFYCVLTDTMLDIAGGLTAGVQSLSGAGAVNLTTYTTALTTTGGAQALTLANGTHGQIKTIIHEVDGGSAVLTPTTKTGFTTITFTDVGDSATLVYLNTRGWMITALNGAVAA